MRADPKKVTDLVDFVTVDASHVICYFKCNIKNKTVVSTVPFEPFKGKITFTIKDILLHPIKSYNRYYHTPITIFGEQCQETIVLKAFKNVSNYFTWNQQQDRYIYT